MSAVNFKTIFLFLLSSVFLIMPVVNAQDSEQSTETELNTNQQTVNKEIDDIKGKEESEDDLQSEDENGTVGRSHKFFSKSVLGAANSMDAFFGSERTISEANKTRIRIRFDFDFEQDEDFEFTPLLRANISLPRTQDRLHLFINGDEGDAGELETDIEDNSDSGTFFLRYYFYKTPWGSAATDTGIRIRSSTVAWFGGVRGRLYRTYGQWGFRITDRFRWFTDRKFTNDTRLDIERVIISQKTFFRSSTKGRWFQKKEGYFMEQKFTVFHIINKKLGLAPEWRTLAETQLDDFIKETRLRFRIRRNVKWKWLFVEIAPGVVWKEENDFDTNFAIRFRIDAYFGNLSKLKLF